VSAPNPIRQQEDVLERAIRGETAAIGVLLKQLAPGMIRAARSLMGTTHADTDDVVQQSLIGLVQALPAFRGECSIAHFASRIVTRTALAARRRNAIRGDRVDDAIEPDAFAVEPSQAEAFEAERRRHAVRSLMEQLPEEQAETLALRVVLGFSLEEVAQATGVPLNTVRSRVRLAKTSLKKRIESDPRLLSALEVE
jgi:RNA polymerase sigma-70 factor (ECF subfamily)